MAIHEVTLRRDNGLGDTAGTLSKAILDANNAAGDDTIVLKTDVLVFGVMKRLINSNITITGDDPATTSVVETATVSGGGSFRPLFVKSGTVNLENLTLHNGKAKGGDSGSGGGGAGMGGALFIYDGTVGVQNVNFTSNAAVGGSNSVPGLLVGGGGGMYGNASDGGGGMFGAAAGANGGYGGTSAYGGFGGYLGYDSDVYGSGGFGGGGFGGYGGGSGGFGGGGGGGSWGYGGNGGFGGGGADGYYVVGGAGGYGGGGGFGYYEAGGAGGFGGGYGGPAKVGNGGGGAGMGGAIFIRSGNLTVSGSSFSSNSATGGSGYNPGLGLGGAIFAMKSTNNSNGNDQGMPTVLPTVALNGVTFSGNTAANDGGTPSPTPDTINSGDDLNNDDLFGNQVTRASGNAAPTDLALSNNAIDESVGAGTAVGNFSTTDPDTGDTFTYNLVAGTGDTDNGAFTVSGDQLTINSSPDFETKSTYSIRVQTTDAAGEIYQKELTINVNELPENSPPTGFNTDSTPDIFWRNKADGRNVIELIDSATTTASSQSNLNARTPGWKVEAFTDFNNDSTPDILWRNHSDGRNVIELMDGTTATASSQINLNSRATDWNVEAFADFNTDGVPDILWRHGGGRNQIWLMDSSGNIASSSELNRRANNGWQIESVTDFNTDGVPDIFWRHNGDGRNAIELIDGTTATVSSQINLSARPYEEWKVESVSDFNADGVPDIFWRNYADGRNNIWLMDGTTGDFSSQSTLSSRNLTWKVESVADFNGDSVSDIFWRQTNGTNQIWLMDGATANVSTTGSPTSRPLEWGIEQASDFNGDGVADILWRNNTDGRAGIWSIDGATGTESTQTTLTSRPSDEWQVVSPEGDKNVDMLTGETAVADTFELGNATQPFYDEAFGDDYGLIVGFASGEDTIQLSGASGDYSLQENVAGLPAGTAIYLTATPVHELVGVVKDVSGLDLATGSDFSFV